MQLRERARRLIADARQGVISPNRDSTSRSGSNSGNETPSELSRRESPNRSVISSPDPSCDNVNKVRER